jgi:hypothetical protein
MMGLNNKGRDESKKGLVQGRRVRLAEGVAKLDFTEKQLKNWKLVEHFRSVLLPRLEQATKHPSEEDPRRWFTADAYFSLFLFRLFNPIITSMRGLCAATQFRKVRAFCPEEVAPATFSEGQQLFNGKVLEQMVRDLAEQCRGRSEFGEARVREAVKGLTVVDGTVLRAVGRMAWAPAAGPGSAIRINFHFSVFDQVPSQWSITPGKVSEAREWKKMAREGAFYVGDRLYGQDLLHLKQLDKARIHFVVRMRDDVTRRVQQEPSVLSQADQQAGVVSDTMAELGCLGGGPKLRIVEIDAGGNTFVLATNRHDLPAEMIGLIYRYRWQIELYFKWFKTMLPCRHWLAESAEGVTIQIYSVMIASLLLFLWTGQRPSKRQMEALQFYWAGLADEDELVHALAREKKH